jgi:hypothetical protein
MRSGSEPAQVIPLANNCSSISPRAMMQTLNEFCQQSHLQLLFELTNEYTTMIRVTEVLHGSP